jgi:hypothetical protein
VIQSRAEHVMGQRESAHGPLGSPLVTAEEILPVEACWQGFQRRADVTEPQGRRGAVAQQMEAKMTELIFGRQDPDGHIGKTHRLRAIVWCTQRAVVQRRDTLVQVDGAGATAVRSKSGERERILIGPDVQVDVPVRSQPAFWIESGDGPAFRQQRLDSSAVQQFQALDELVFAKGRLKNVVAINLSEVMRRVAAREV